MIQHIIGYYAPYILFVITIFLMPSKTLVLAFILGFILNSMINGLVKYFIAEPRPSQEYQHIDMFGKVELKSSSKRGSIHQYGMPSGHAQHAWFCVVYVWCVLNNVYINLFYSILAVYTSVQRVDLNNHTARQVIVGSIIGGFLGYLTYKNRRLSDIFLFHSTY